MRKPRRPSPTSVSLRSTPRRPGTITKAIAVLLHLFVDIHPLGAVGGFYHPPLLVVRGFIQKTWRT
ncbi:hypothetical protein HPP92_014988 [Vanilla planifolia]|uniref:Uncharacterized protein n=1 Tax=Vanilla planifolia TaxID=51239 RepID=A0A835QWX5_VANPL|nr:hypothetical protein HPP92_014988 [Vanilla planifolia]